MWVRSGHVHIRPADGVLRRRVRLERSHAADIQPGPAVLDVWGTLPTRGRVPETGEESRAERGTRKDRKEVQRGSRKEERQSTHGEADQHVQLLPSQNDANLHEEPKRNSEDGSQSAGFG